MVKIKFIFLSLASLFLCTATFANVQFMDGAWSDILAKAEKEDKLIFLDAYTDWCVPCKKMDKEVFTEEAVSDMFNEQFVNVKINMEKGEGVELAKRYNILAYPSLMFIAADGSMVHRVAGYQNVKQIIDQANTALDPNKRLSGMQAKFDQGERDPAFLQTLTKLKFKAVDGGHHEVAEAFMEVMGEDMQKSKNMNFIFKHVTDTDSKLFDFVLDNRDRFAEMYGKSKVTKKIQDLIFSKVEDTKDESSLEQVEKLYARVYPEQAEQLAGNFRMNFYRQIGDYDKYAESVVDYANKFNLAGDQLNDIAYTFYEKIEDSALLKQATKWVKKSIKQNSNYFNNDTLAALYYKLGKTKKAKKIALKAIAMAQLNGHDHSSTNKLLEMINFDKVKMEE